jgi:hypothetical protein
MASHDVTFEISDELHEEAEQIAAEMGIGVDEIALQAFVAWVLGVRQARLLDVDESSGSNLDRLPSANQPAVELEGDEAWLDDERRD